MLERFYKDWEFKFDTSINVLFVYKKGILISRTIWENWTDKDFHKTINLTIKSLTYYDSPLVVGDNVIVDDTENDDFYSLRKKWVGQIKSVVNETTFKIINVDSDCTYLGQEFFRYNFLLEKML